MLPHHSFRRLRSRCKPSPLNLFPTRNHEKPAPASSAKNSWTLSTTASPRSSHDTDEEFSRCSFSFDTSSSPSSAYSTAPWFLSLHREEVEEEVLGSFFFLLFFFFLLPPILLLDRDPLFNCSRSFFACSISSKTSMIRRTSSCDVCSARSRPSCGTTGSSTSSNASPVCRPIPACGSTSSSGAGRSAAGADPSSLPGVHLVVHRTCRLGGGHLPERRRELQLAAPPPALAVFWPRGAEW